MEKQKNKGKWYATLYIASRVAILLSAFTLPFIVPQWRQLHGIALIGLALGLALTLATLLCFLFHKPVFRRLQMAAWGALAIGWGGLAQWLTNKAALDRVLGRGDSSWVAVMLYFAIVVEFIWVLSVNRSKLSDATAHATRPKEPPAVVPPELELILRDYIAQDDALGLSFGKPLGEGYHVAYHSELGPTQSPPEDLREEGDFPFVGEFALQAHLGTDPLNPSDYRFGPKFMEVYKRHLPDCGTDRFIELDDAQTTKIYDALSGNGHKIGGYPSFAQEDPRHSFDMSSLPGYAGSGAGASDEEASPYDTLLLQIDSEDDIMWGDCGVANFFIPSQMLQAKDFSNVLYNWDCY